MNSGTSLQKLFLVGEDGGRNLFQFISGLEAGDILILHWHTRTLIHLHTCFITYCIHRTERERERERERKMLEYYIPCMYYIRTCTDISICPLHLGSTRPWACRALHATKVSDYKQLSLQLHFDVVAEHCYTRAVSQQTPTDKWQQLQQQGQPAHSSMTLQAYTGTNWPHHSSMVTTVSTRIGNTSS